MTAPDATLRHQINTFYAALRTNDVEKIQEMLRNDFPIEWAQVFSETSLPEYAMRHGAVEAAWVVMSAGVLPEKWSAFTGDAWKAFLKKGWEMATTSTGARIPLEEYTKIAKVGLKVTGQNFPGWLDKMLDTTSVSAASLASNLRGSFGSLWSKWTEKPRPVYVEPVKVERPVGPIPPREQAAVAPSRSAKRSSKSASAKTVGATKKTAKAAPKASKTAPTKAPSANPPKTSRKPSK